ncbi:YecA/YgfB family protein [Azohydromonas australica]|uniref:YecA/YgfB family protein n=1 Tax=Azohydromonas australica TaxID=364039 RepID=UPI00042877A0|nr:YecA family protein [Azohydromonas australica]
MTPRSAPEFSPLDERELAELEQLLDALPTPLEPLDVSMTDGYLVGVLLQPQTVPAAQWLRHVTDADGREAPPSASLQRLHELVRRRHAELERAIAQRQWFDPWVWELDEDASPSEAVMPWVAGFATAMEFFPALMRLDGPALLEPLAQLFMHLDPEDLEDADDLLAEIETLEPPSDMAEAVEMLVRASLLLADISRPRKAQPPARKTARRPGPPPGRRPPPRR